MKPHVGQRSSSATAQPAFLVEIGATAATRALRNVAAHGNSLRGLVKHLDGLSDDAVVSLNIPTGIPLRYELDEKTLMPTAPGEYLDPDAAAEAIEAVANQGKK